jgi:hypothetical protein
MRITEFSSFRLTVEFDRLSGMVDTPHYAVSERGAGND